MHRIQKAAEFKSNFPRFAGFEVGDRLRFFHISERKIQKGVVTLKKLMYIQNFLATSS